MIFNSDFIIHFGRNFRNSTNFIYFMLRAFFLLGNSTEEISLKIIYRIWVCSDKTISFSIFVLDELVEPWNRKSNKKN